MTGNVACAAFHHDSSWMLSPQLHTHLVIANVSFDEKQQRWMALQPRIMLEVSKQTIQAQVLDDLDQRAENLGYRVSAEDGGLRIDGISLELEERYWELFRRKPIKERIEAFIKEGKSAAKVRFSREFEVGFRRGPSLEGVDKFVKYWRSANLKKTSTAEVRKSQLSQLSGQERRELEEMTAKARESAANIKGRVLEEKSRNVSLSLMMALKIPRLSARRARRGRRAEDSGWWCPVPRD